MRVYHTCKEHCPATTTTTITYIRHDHLVGIHGESHLQTSVCEHWWSLAASQDIIMLSAAAHVNELILFPNETATRGNANITLDRSAVQIANKLKHIPLKPNAVVMYMTASSGIYNFSKDCTLPPENIPLPHTDHYNWNMVPYMQQSYVKTIRQAMNDRHQPFLVLDLQYLTQMRRGCRGDFVHAFSDVKSSPYFNTWMMLYNLLMEYRTEEHPVSPEA